MKKILVSLGLLCVLTPYVSAGMDLINHHNRHWAGPMGCVAGSSFAIAGLASIARVAAEAQYPDDIFTSQRAGIGAAAIVGGTALLWYSINRLTRETALDALEKATTVFESLNAKYCGPIAFMHRPNSNELAVIYQNVLSHAHGTLAEQAQALKFSIKEASKQQCHLEKYQNEIRHYACDDVNKFNATKQSITALTNNLPHLLNWSERVQTLNNAASWNSINQEAIKNALQLHTTVEKIQDINKISSEDIQAIYWRFFDALNQLWPNSNIESAMFSDINRYISALQDPLNIPSLEIIRLTIVNNFQDVKKRLTELQAFKNDFIAWKEINVSYNSMIQCYSEALKESSIISLDSINAITATRVAYLLMGSVATNYNYPLVSLLQALEMAMTTLEQHFFILNGIASRHLGVPILYQEATRLIIQIQELNSKLAHIKIILLAHPNYSEQVAEKRHQDYNKELQEINGQLTEVRTQYTTLNSTVSTQKTDLERKITDTHQKIIAAQREAKEYTDQRDRAMSNYVGNLDYAYGTLSASLSTLQSKVGDNTANIMTLWNKVFGAPKKQ